MVHNFPKGPSFESLAIFSLCCLGSTAYLYSYQSLIIDQISCKIVALLILIALVIEGKR